MKARWQAAFISLAALGLIGACDKDPVHDNEVTALGPDVTPPGAFHRPGQPCLVCHGGSGPAVNQFAVAGTIYQAQSGELVPQSGAVVTLVDTSGVHAQATSNAAGNFWVLTERWVPKFPVHVVSFVYNDIATTMTTHIGRDGSCADCHSDPPGGDLVGHLYLAAGDEPDGGFPGGGP